MQRNENRRERKNEKSWRNKEGSKTEIKIGTWNVRGLNQVGAMKQLISEIRKQKFEIVALQETKQKESVMMEIEKYAFLNSGGDNRVLGTGFLVSPEIKSLIMKFKPVSDRLCYLRIRGKFQNISLINIHAPTEEADLESKEAFYEKLQKEYDEIPRYDLKIVLGDANAKIGKEEIYKQAIGKHSKHDKTSDNGQMLVDFAMEKNMRIKSTCFKKKEIHKGTWRAPNGDYTNQIDHVLVEREDERNITDIRSYRGIDIDSDHFMVGIKVRQTIPEKK
ncbi:craniofacial development protein 2-like [Anoplophora glabripennis]|uniref:craniofacial development protein 2-like n=1 Tax=Anoplophora glabripennis TaxID=217634 RepID=UPI000C7832C2|nr:craniofacial development protein 2-like [Anoplophora glabripennis]